MDVDNLNTYMLIFMIIFSIALVSWAVWYDKRKLYNKDEWKSRKHWDAEYRRQQDERRAQGYRQKFKQEQRKRKQTAERLRERTREANRQNRSTTREQIKATFTRKPVRSQILGVGHDTKKTGTMGRAAVGAMTFGAVGAVVGAATAGSKQTGDNISFLVFFSNGDKEIETVHKNSGRYKELMAVLDTENPTA